MSADVVYEIARDGVAEDDEVLLERAQVVRTNGSHSWRLGDSETRVISDVASVIRAEAALHEVRANQVTRVTAVPELVDELPFLLVSPGDRDDFDEAAWSDKLRDEHAYQERTSQTGRYRVLYVNGDRWCSWPTPEGDMLLPEEWPTVRLRDIVTSVREPDSEPGRARRELLDTLGY